MSTASEKQDFNHNHDNKHDDGSELTRHACKRKAPAYDHDEPVGSKPRRREEQEASAGSGDERVGERAVPEKEVPTEEPKTKSSQDELAASAEAAQMNAMDDEDVQWTVDNLGMMIIETINVIVVHTSGQQLKARRAHVTAFQEHAPTPTEERIYKVEVAVQGWHASAGPKDPECTRKSGGVVLQRRQPLRPMPMRIETENFRDAVKSGRLMGCVIDVDGASIIIIVLYGWSGGHHNVEAAARADDLLSIARMELSKQPIGLKMMVGGINGKPVSFQH